MKHTQKILSFLLVLTLVFYSLGTNIKVAHAAGTPFLEANWSGYDEQSLTNPISALTDFSLIIDVSTLSSSWKAAVQSDGADIRLTQGDSTTELPYDLINWVYNAGAPTGLIRVKYSGTMANTGTQNVRVYAGYTGGTATAYDANETYGSQNAYPAEAVAYWPLHDGSDRTGNGNDLTAQGALTFGGVTGQLGLATDWNATTTDVAVSGSTHPALSALTWMTMQNTPSTAVVFSHLIFWNTNNRMQRKTFLSPKIGGTQQDMAGFVNGGNIHMAVTVDGSGNAEHFIDSASSSAKVLGTPSITASSTVKLGEAGYDGWQQHVWVFNDVRSDAWILEEYLQLNSQSTFWGTWAWTATSAGATVAHVVVQFIGNVIITGNVKFQ